MTIPNTLQLRVICQIHQDGISELLKQGYSEVQIMTFIRQNIQACFNTDKITVPITDIDVEVIDSDGTTDIESVLQQFIRYCEQWQRSNGEFQNGDGRTLILHNARKALDKTEVKL